MKIEIKTEWEGRMGFSLTKVYEIYVDEELCGWAKRKWLAEEIANAINLGNITKTGDTTGKLADWAYKNNYKLFQRIEKAA